MASKKFTIKKDEYRESLLTSKKIFFLLFYDKITFSFLQIEAPKLCFQSSNICV